MSWILLAFILFSAICAVALGAKAKWAKEVYYFVGFSMLLLTVVYGITILDWEIVGSGVSVKKAKEEVNQAKEDVLAVQRQLVYISTSTIELTDLAAECASRFGGCAGDSRKEIERKQGRLLKYIDEITKRRSAQK
jgi:hypothetical protein